MRKLGSYENYLYNFVPDEGPKECKTRADSKFDPNKPCKFPFTFEGKTYDKCVDLTIKSKTYEDVCATAYKSNQGIEIGGLGTCREECPRETSKFIQFIFYHFI